MLPPTHDSERDALYAAPHRKIGDFAFDDAVAKVFPDMIKRSVPGYSAIIAMIGILAGHYAQPQSTCYDLGCSLGAATLAMRKHLGEKSCRMVAVDNSPAMIQRCREYIAADHSLTSVDLVCADIRDVEIRHASVVVLNFTLQFIEPQQRLSLLQRIQQGMVPGGILILSEKIIFADPWQQQLHSQTHHQFKKANGYSELEISQKRTALEKVLVPETLSSHRQRALSAGFRRFEVWFQCLNFISMIARK